MTKKEKKSLIGLTPTRISKFATKKLLGELRTAALPRCERGRRSLLLYGDEGTQGSPHLIKSAFTLAEVLITLGVIGVVAAMTMPTLIQKVEEHILISQLKQAYAMLNTATRMIVANEGELKDLDLGTLNTAEGSLKLLEVYAPYLKVQKKCGVASGCYPLEYALNSHIPYISQPNTHQSFANVRLENGMSLSFWSGGKGCTYQNEICGSIKIDVNGDKKPNTAGKDFYSFLIYNNYIRPEGEREYVNEYGRFCDEKSTSELNGIMCTARVLEREKFDYSPW